MKLLKYIFFTAAILMSSLALYAGETVKYVFLFIGDGMSIPQRMTAEEFSRINTGKGLAMNSMPHQALTITRSKNSFITDSASSYVRSSFFESLMIASLIILVPSCSVTILSFMDYHSLSYNFRTVRYPGQFLFNFTFPLQLS